MFDPDFFCFLSFDCRRDMKKRFPSFCTILLILFKVRMRQGERIMTYVFYFFYRKICVGGHAYNLWPYVNNNHDRSCDESLEEVVDLLI